VLTRPAAILFDWDNTLVDSWSVIRQALNETLVEMGHQPWSIEETRARVRHSLRNSFPPLFGEAWERARDHYLARFEAIHLDRLAPLAGAREQLDWIGAAGIYTGIVSNKTGRLLRREVEALDWTARFGRIVGAGDAASDKPSRAPVDLVLAESGIEAGDRVWYVGDTGIDVDCALAATCVPVLVHVGDSDPEHERESMARARYRFADFAEMGRVLGSL
jgi:phosphoglycolate phosphatase